MASDMLNVQTHNMEQKHEITSVRCSIFLFFIVTTLWHEVRTENWPNIAGFAKT